MPPPEKDARGITEMLLDAAWLHDELARLGANAPGVSERFVIMDPVKGQKLFSGDNWRNLLALTTGAMGIDWVAEMLGVSTYRVRVIIGMAVEKKVVKIIDEAG